jgi:hypothetical protein
MKLKSLSPLEKAGPVRSAFEEKLWFLVAALMAAMADVAVMLFLLLIRN